MKRIALSGMLLFACIGLVPGVAGASTSGVSDVSAGWETICAVKAGGVWCWGESETGILGSDGLVAVDEPHRIKELASDVTLVENDGFTACAIVAGAARCWGYDLWGLLGTGAYYEYGYSDTPVPAAGLDSGVTDLSLAGYAACAVKSGDAYCWGENLNGAIGDGLNHHDDTGSERVQRTPRKVSVLPPDAVVTKVSTGGYGGNTCVVADGGLWCWGSDDRELVANGPAGASITAHAVSGFQSGVTDVEMGSDRACVLKDGKAYCWGNRIDNFGTYDLPVEVADFGAGTTDLSMGHRYDCAVVAGGAKCRGEGELGNGSVNEDYAVVVPTGLDSAVSKVSRGSDRSCGLAAVLKCWIGDGLPEIVDFDEESPTLAIAGPTAPVTENPATFELQSNEDGWFECAVEPASLDYCDPTHSITFNPGSTGTHTFTAVAVDPAGNRSAAQSVEFELNIPSLTLPVVPGKPAPGIPGIPAVSPRKLNASLVPRRQARKAPKTLALVAELTSTDGSPLTVNQCRHKIRVHATSGSVKLSGRVSYGLVGDKCVANITVKLPRKARGKKFTFSGQFWGSPYVVPYSVSAAVRIRR